MKKSIAAATFTLGVNKIAMKSFSNLSFEVEVLYKIIAHNISDVRN